MLAVTNVDQEIIWKLEDQSIMKEDKVRKGYYRNYKILDAHKFKPNFIESTCGKAIKPWVQTAIGNIRRLINGIYHHISDKFSQLYFDEFSFKFNYRNHKIKWLVVFEHSIIPYW